MQYCDNIVDVHYYQIRAYYLCLYFAPNNFFVALEFNSLGTI
jgi:hypothetical protein